MTTARVEDSAEQEPARADETSTDQTVEHVLMLSTAAGYRIVIGDGAQPTPTVEVDGVVYQVSGRMASPFPGDTRTRLLRDPLGLRGRAGCVRLTR